MKEDFPDKITDEMLAKYFAGEASVEESAAIRAWADRSPANREMLWQWQLLWLDTGHVEAGRDAVEREFDVEAAWQKVKARKQQAERKKSSFPFLRIAAGIAVLLGIGLIVRYYLQQPELQTFTATGQATVMELTDGSSVILKEGSSLTYPEKFGGQRKVSLKGEAFFEVEPDPQQPFVVEAEETNIKVLGTSFNVRIGTEEITVLVESGKVVFSHREEEIILTAGQRGVYSRRSHVLGTPEPSSSTGVEEFWRTRTLQFSGQKLPEVVDALEKAYGTEILLEGENLAACSLNVSFRDDSLDNILEIIALTLNLEVQRSGGEIILKGEGCY